MPDLLEDDLRATAPQPDEAFLTRLESRVEAGFPKPAKAPRQRRSLFRPALALAACVLAGMVVSIGVLTQDGAEFTSDTTSISDDSAAGGASEAAPAAPRSAGDAVAPGSVPRKREQSVTLDLATPADEFAETTAGVLRIADATGTIVQRSNVSQTTGGDTATYDLRVPTSRLDEAMRRLSELGDVRSRNENVQDITASYVSARDRLQDARDVRAALLKSLARADTERERSAIRARLRDVRTQIAGAESEVRRIRQRTDRARVDVTVRSTGESGAWTPGDAFDDALRILEVVAGVALVVAAIALPIALLVALGVAAARLTRRRRRNAVLG